MITCTAGDLAPAASADFVIPVQVASSATPGATLAGTVSATNTSDPTGATGAADIIVGAAAADLVVTVTGPATPIEPGETGTVSINVDNLGPSDAANTSVVYTLPTGVILDPAATLPAGCSEAPTGVVTCAAGDIVAAANLDLVIALALPADATPSTDFDTGTVTATSDADDPDAVNSTDVNSTVTSGPGSADLAVTVGSAPSLQPGQSGTINLTIDNAGPSDSGTFDVVTTLPAGVSFDATAANPNTCTDASGVVTCTTTGPVASGGTGTIVVPVTMDTVQSTSGTARNASIAFANLTAVDPVATNDTASAVVTLLLTGDTDADGILDADEIDPGSTGSVLDTDGDGTPDYLDTDSDNDTVSDNIETDGGDVSIDTDGDGLPDYRDVDSDADGVADRDEPTGDSDGDGIPDRRDYTPIVVSGVVTDAATGQPVAGALVVLTDTDGHSYTVVAATDGTYRFESSVTSPLTPGTVELMASAPNFVNLLGSTNVAYGQQSVLGLELNAPVAATPPANNSAPTANTSAPTANTSAPTAATTSAPATPSIVTSPTSGRTLPISGGGSGLLRGAALVLLMGLALVHIARRTEASWTLD